MLTSIVALGVFIAIYGILTERKEKTLLFVLSLPISTTQYTAAKVASSLIAFLIPWLVLTVTIVVLTLTLEASLDGRLPFTITMMFFFLANFCVLVAVTHHHALGVLGGGGHRDHEPVGEPVRDRPSEACPASASTWKGRSPYGAPRS